VTGPKADYLGGGGIVHGWAARLGRRECRRHGHLWYAYRGRTLTARAGEVCAPCDRIRRVEEPGNSAEAQTA